jgi:serine/threonine-protein kinase RsbW
MALRTVSAACKLVTPNARTRGSYNSFVFTDQVVSAVGEVYNNIVLHGYAGREPDSIHLQIEIYPGWMRVTMKDMGTSYDPFQAPSPDLDTLPESGLGIFIMRSFVDEVTYVAGRPNTLTLVKRLDQSGGSGSDDTLQFVSKAG